MKLFFPIPIILLLLCSCSNYIYVIRHAEKASPGSNPGKPNDPPLSDSGRQRANNLLGILKHKKIKYVFATNTLRAMATADPTARYFSITSIAYPGVPDSIFISRIKSLKGNILIVGHSNTVDDIVNKLCGEQLLMDLPESAFDNLYVVKRKRKRYSFRSLKY